MYDNKIWVFDNIVNYEYQKLVADTLLSNKFPWFFLSTKGVAIWFPKFKLKKSKTTVQKIKMKRILIVHQQLWNPEDK